MNDKINISGSQITGANSIGSGSSSGNFINSIDAQYQQNISGTDSIEKILESLVQIAESFSSQYKELAITYVEDLRSDLKQKEKNPSKLRMRILSLLSIVVTLGGGIAGVADFANNVLDLSQKLQVPFVEIQPQLSQVKQLYPDFKWNLPIDQ
ncbi:hypothetical protein QGP82_28735 [Leptothoe sp. LEGE 181152]|nr:hypothetical protein [Leptothoe sp. LEGE 181152]